MSRIMMAIFVLGFLTIPLNAQPSISLGAGVGMTRPAGKTHDLGFSGRVSVFLDVTEQLAVTVSGGYQQWEDRPSFNLNPYAEQNSVRLYVASFGAQYRILAEGISPYIAAEIEYLRGTRDGTVLFPLAWSYVPTEPRQYSRDIAEIGSAGSAGVLIPLNETFMLDLAGTIRLSAATGALLYMGLGGGVRVRL